MQGKVDCRPDPARNGAYPAGRTLYNDATHRAINLLVETAFTKAPGDNQAGAWGEGWRELQEGERQRASGGGEGGRESSDARGTMLHVCD